MFLARANFSAAPNTILRVRRRATDRTTDCQALAKALVRWQNLTSRLEHAAVGLLGEIEQFALKGVAGRQT